MDNLNMDAEDEDSDVELDRRLRLVIFGKIDLTIKAGLAHHWGVKLVECPHDPPCGVDPPEKGEEEEEEEEGASSSTPSPQRDECMQAEGVWYEVDGFQMDDPKNLKNNSINGSDDYTTPGEHRGVKSRLQSAPEKIVGFTERSDVEIFIFNKDYLERNPKYSLLRNNCQNYADEFCDFLCKTTGVLPTAGILLENVKDALQKVRDNAPEGVKEAILAAEAAAADEGSVVHEVVQKSKFGFAKLRSFKNDYKAKWKAKFGGGTPV